MSFSKDEHVLCFGSRTRESNLDPMPSLSILALRSRSQFLLSRILVRCGVIFKDALTLTFTLLVSLSCANYVTKIQTKNSDKGSEANTHPNIVLTPKYSYACPRTKWKNERNYSCVCARTKWEN